VPAARRLRPLERAEGVAHDAAVPWRELVEPTFVAGLLLQLPFAAAGYLIARLLLRGSDAVRRLKFGNSPVCHVNDHIRAGMLTRYRVDA
jgi:hypothetical protein